MSTSVGWSQITQFNYERYKLMGLSLTPLKLWLNILGSKFMIANPQLPRVYHIAFVCIVAVVNCSDRYIPVLSAASLRCNRQTNGLLKMPLN